MGVAALTIQPITGASMKFLIVEDDTVASIDLECILEDLGHTVADVAVSPVFALNAMRKVDVDAVIFGATVVGLPPYVLADEVRRRGLPCAVTSSHPAEFARILGFKMPFLHKPYEPGEVARVVSELGGGSVATAA